MKWFWEKQCLLTSFAPLLECTLTKLVFKVLFVRPIPPIQSTVYKIMCHTIFYVVTQLGYKTVFWVVDCLRSLILSVIRMDDISELNNFSQQGVLASLIYSAHHHIKYEYVTNYNISTLSIRPCSSNIPVQK